jgi:hypothetical protein
VRCMDAFHAQKWSASAIPEAEASAASREVRARHSRHSPVISSAAATMTSEKQSRHAAMASGSELERWTSGPAKEMPSSEKARTTAGLRDKFR